MPNNNPNGGAQWKPEHVDALRGYLETPGKSFEKIAQLLNEQFGTSYSRNSAIGKAARLGLQSLNRSGVNLGARKPRKSRAKHSSTTRIVKANISGGMKIIRSVATEQYKLRCVEIVPRNLTLLELEPNDCRYPYGEGPYTFCGHPKKPGSSYCTPHFHLCDEPSKPLRSQARKFFGTDFARSA